jgi:hypothetical protein
MPRTTDSDNINAINPSSARARLPQEAETLQELAQSGGCGGGQAWGSDARRSCIYETTAACPPEARASFQLFRQYRTTWPLRQRAWQALFESRAAELAVRLLGPGALLFNEQARSPPPAGSAQGARIHAVPPPCCCRARKPRSRARWLLWCSTPSASVCVAHCSTSSSPA